MDGIINVRVNGYSIVKDHNCAGAQFEGNSTKLRIEFSEDWKKYVKTVTFWNALGNEPVKVTLGESMAEDVLEENPSVYLVPIPAEAMTEAGMFPFTIDGYLDGVRKRTVETSLKVLPSRKSDKQDPSPTLAEQLQKQIDTVCIKCIEVYVDEVDKLMTDGVYKVIKREVDGPQIDIGMVFNPYYITVSKYAFDDGLETTVCQIKFDRGEVRRRFYNSPLYEEDGWTPWEDITQQFLRGHCVEIEGGRISIDYSEQGTPEIILDGYEREITVVDGNGIEHKLTQKADESWVREEIDDVKAIIDPLNTVTDNLNKTAIEQDERIETQKNRLDVLEDSLEKPATVSADAGTKYRYTVPAGYRVKSFETVTLEQVGDLFLGLSETQRMEFGLFDADNYSLFIGEIEEGTTEINVIYPYDGEYYLGKGFYFEIYIYDTETNTTTPFGSGTHSVMLNFTLETLTAERFDTLETEIDALESMANGITPNLKTITANAIKGKVSGRAVCFDDVSPFEHQLSVKVHNSGEVWYDPITDVKVRRYGKNLLNNSDLSDLSKWSRVDNSYQTQPIYVGKGNIVTVSYKKTLETGLGMHVFVSTINSTANDYKKMLYSSTSSTMIQNKVTLTATSDYIYLAITTQHATIEEYNAKFMEYIGNELQVEIGTQATAFEEYVEPMYYSLRVKAEDILVGIADGIMSLSPSMTLIVDTEGVPVLESVDFELEAEYNKDTNKVIEALTDETNALKEQWRLINEVTLEEDAVVEFTADKDGNAFDLKKIKVTVSMPQLETQSQVWLSVANGVQYYLAVYSPSIATTATNPAVSIMGELTYAWQFETCYSNAGLSNNGTVISFPRGTRYSGDITEPLCKVKISLNSAQSTPLPAGSKIKFWGVDV